MGLQKRIIVAMTMLPDALKQIRELEKRVGELEERIKGQSPRDLS